MPRTKGSKNKKKSIVTTADYAALITEKQNAKATITEQVQGKEEQLTSLKAEIKVLHSQIKSLDKEIAKLESAQTAQAAAEAEEAKMAELESVLKQLMADGMSTQEILDKLK